MAGHEIYVTHKSRPNRVWSVDSYMGTHHRDVIVAGWERMFINTGRFTVTVNMTGENVAPVDMDQFRAGLPVAFAEYGEAFGDFTVDWDNLVSNEVTPSMEEGFIGAFNPWETWEVEGLQVITDYLVGINHMQVPDHLLEMSEMIHRAKAQEMIAEGYFVCGGTYIWSNLDKK